MKNSSLTALHWGFAHMRVAGNLVQAASPFEQDSHPSPLMDGVPDAVHSSSRVLRPSVRKGWLQGDRNRGSDDFIEMEWDEAYDLIEASLRTVLNEKGNSGVFAGSYGWGSAGRFHHAATHLKRFLNQLGGFVDQKQTYSFAAGQIICPHVVGDNRILFGGETTTWPAILDNAKIIVFFGGINLTNTQIAAGGLGNHATPGWMAEAARRDIEVWSISPIRDELAELPNLRWLPIRPGSDVALMMALAHETIRQGRIDSGFLERYTVGHESVIAYVAGEIDGQPKTVEWASGITGIPEETIRALADALVAKPSFLTASWSLQRQQHGEQPLWMLIALSAMLGEIGLPGRGVSFGHGSTGNRGDPRPRISSPSFSAGKNPLGRFIPVSRVADMLLEPGKTIRFDGQDLVYPDIDLVWWAGGNPFHHHQDLNRLVEAFRKPKTIIVNEIWWTSTARQADIVLPACTALERNDLSGSPTDRYTAAMHKQIEPVGQSRSEYDIFLPLAQRFGVSEGYGANRSEMEWLRHIYQDFQERALKSGAELIDFDTFWQEGHVALPVLESHYTLFSDFRADPIAHPLKTPSGKIELRSKTIEAAGHADIAPYPVWIEPSEWLGNASRQQLHLVSPQPSTRLHSQLDGVGISRGSKVDGREPILIHPSDAHPRHIRDGDLVIVSNDRGQCIAAAKVSDIVMPGVVSLPTGAWYTPAKPGASNSLELHGNPNVLTTNTPTSTLSYGPAHHTALVTIEKATLTYPRPAVHDSGPILKD